MKPEERRARIIATLRDHGRATVEELAVQLAISRETIRRDLTDLSDRGLIRKFHGGATLPEAAGEGAFQDRMTRNTAAKRAVARRAAALFAPGESLLVDSGSTTVLFAEELADTPGITLITNGVMVAQAMARGGRKVRVFLIGGEFVDEGSELLGAIAVQQVGSFFADHAVLTVAALHVGGAMDFDEREAALARTMIAQAGRVTILLDGSKLGRTALFRVCRLEDIDRVVCDTVPEPALLQALHLAGTEVVIASDP